MSSSVGQIKISIENTRPGLVTASIAVPSGDLPGAGSPDAQTLVAIAEEIMTRGAALDRRAHRSAFAVETSVRQFRRDWPRSATAAARQLDLGNAAIVWQVTFAARGADDRPLATVSQTRLIAERGHTEGLDPDRDRVPDVESLGETQRKETTPAAARREQIEVAAADIIARKGFAGASIREIAEAVGMHVPTLYQYIASKDELLELVYSRTMATLKADLDAEVEGHVTAKEKLRTAIGILVGRSDRYRHRIGLLNRELRSLSAEARVRVLDQYRDLMGATAAIIRHGIATGEFRAVESDVVANLVDGACDMWALRRFALSHVGIETFTDEITELFLRGLRRKDEPAS